MRKKFRRCGGWRIIEMFYIYKGVQEFGCGRRRVDRKGSGGRFEACMKNIAPDIFRKRLLIEGYYSIDVDKQKVSDYLLGLAAHLGLRVYGEPIVFSPDSGMGKDENAGYDAFVPLIDSGISAYVWSKARFLSTVLYTCKDFDSEKAIAYTQDFWKITGETITHTF